METTAASSQMPPIFLTRDQKKILTRLGNGLPERWTVDRYATELIQRGGFIPVRDYLLSLYRKTAGPLVTDKQQPTPEVRHRIERVIPPTRRAEVQQELDPLQRWLKRHYPTSFTCASCGNLLSMGDQYQITARDELIHSRCEAA